MTSKTLCTFKHALFRWQRHALMASSLCLLVACGGAGETNPTAATPTPRLTDSLGLTISPSGTVQTGTTIQITPTFTLPSDLTLVSSVVLVNDASPIAATSGTTVLHTPTVNTAYKLKVCYTDTHAVPAVSNCETKSSTATSVQLVSGPTKLSTGGQLNIARSDFTATALSNGMVMIAGGINGAGAVEKSVELYDPVSNTWSLTGDMKTARRGHAATLLRDGRVLVTGGYDGTTATTALNKAETYDPSTGIWTNTSGTLVQARRWHTSTLLNDNKVLIVGGSVSSGSGTVAELFDPSDGSFAETTPMRIPRQGHTATLLPTGHVLIIGRNNSDNTYLTVNSVSYESSRTTEVYNPTAATWSDGPVLSYGRYAHAATLMGNSKQLLVTGGYDYGTNKAEVLNVSATPLTASWITTTDMATARALHTSTYINASNKVLVIGGYNASSQMLTSTEMFSLNPVSTAASTWSTSGNKELALGRAMHTSTLLSNGNVLVVGTYYSTSGTVSNTTEIWSP